MKKRILLGLFGVFIVWLAYSAGVVYALPTGSHITNDPEQLQYGYDPQIFVSDGGTYFAFYGCYGDDGIYYAYSDDDGDTWTENGTRISAINSDCYDGSVSLCYDGTYVYYAITGGTGDDFKTRRMTLNDAGFVEFSAAMQTATVNNNYRPMIELDSDGHAYAVYYENTSPDYVRIIKNANTDGTWSTASGFPKTIDSSVDSDSYFQEIIIDEYDQIYVVYNSATGTDLSINTVIDDTVGTPTLIDTGINTGAGNGAFSSTLYNNQTLLTVYNKGGTIYLIGYNITAGLGDPVEIVSAQSDTQPLITFDELTNDFYISYLTGGVIYYIRYNAATSTYESAVAVTDTLEDLADNNQIMAPKNVNELDQIYWAWFDDPYYWTFTKIELDADRGITPEQPQTDIIWLWFTDRISLWMGLLGGLMVILAPLFLVKSFKDGDYTGFAIALLIMTTVGAALIIGWLYG